MDTNNTVRTASIVSLIAGIWMVIAPFALGNAGTTAILWNEIIFGIVAIVFAGLQMTDTEVRWPSWVNFIVGIWLIIAPYVIGSYAPAGGAQTNDMIVGIVIALVSLWAALAVPRHVHVHEPRHQPLH